MTRDEAKTKVYEDLKVLPDGRFYRRVPSALGTLFLEMEQGGLVRINKISVEGQKHRITQVVALMDKADE